MDQKVQFLITTILALYGAILSTIIGVIEIKRRYPNIRVIISTRKLFREGLGSSEPIVFCQATNIGAGDQSITGVGILFRKGKVVTILDFYGLNVPTLLKEGRSCHFYLPSSFFSSFKDNADIRKIYFLDETGKQWTGNISKAIRVSWKNDKDEGWKLSDYIKPNTVL